MGKEVLLVGCFVSVGEAVTLASVEFSVLCWEIFFTFVTLLLELLLVGAGVTDSDRVCPWWTVEALSSGDF